MMFTPEMTTCETVSDSIPDDAWEADDCRSGFNFPDDEKLIQAEFAKNIPFALSVAETAAHPDQPSSTVGLSAPDFTPDTFTTSYARGTDQKVAVTARKSVRDKELNYRINGGRTHDEDLRAWKGGETYGGEDNLHFDEYRAEVEDADPGDRVEVWFTGRTKSGKPTTSDRFTYTVAERPRADTLVIADEGAPTQYARAYVDALRANGRTAVVWDVATQGAPHPWASSATSPPPSTTPATSPRTAIRRSPCATSSTRGQADRGGRAGRRQRAGRTHPDERLQPVLPRCVRAFLHGGRHRLHRGGRAPRHVGTARRGARQPAGPGGAYTVTSSVLAPDLFRGSPARRRGRTTSAPARRR